MKRILRLTESDLIRLVKKVVNEQMSPTQPMQQRTTGIPGPKPTSPVQQRTTSVTKPVQQTTTSVSKGSKMEWINKYPCVTKDYNLLYDGMKGTYFDQKNQITYLITGKKLDRSGKASTFACSGNQIVGSVGGSTTTAIKPTGLTKPVQQTTSIPRPTSPTQPTQQRTTGIPRPTSPTRPMS